MHTQRTGFSSTYIPGWDEQRQIKLKTSVF